MQLDLHIALVTPERIKGLNIRFERVENHFTTFNWAKILLYNIPSAQDTNKWD